MDEVCGIPDGAELKKAQELLTAAVAKEGIKGMKQQMEQSLEEWKNVPLYIGVTGRPGVGKSSFINAFRGLSAEDEGAAEIGVTETTTTVKQYPHPLNNKLVLCDLPGVGTPTFSKATYFTDERIGFDKFDMFLIMTADRFMEDDLWLAQGIKERNKGFLFIRTKIDQDVENEKRARKTFYQSNPDAVKDVVEKIRKNCMDNLTDFTLDKNGEQRVFLIDSYACENPLYDFDILTERLIENFPSIKRDAFILSLIAMTPHIIKAKEKVLRGRIWKVSVVSGLGGAVPVPGVSLAIDAGIVLHETIFYRKQLGLEDDKLKEAAMSVGVTWEVFKATAGLQSVTFKYTVAGILKLCSCLMVSEGIETTVQLAIPIIGSILGGALSFGSTYYSLKSILNMMVKDTKKLDEYLRKQLTPTTVL